MSYHNSLVSRQSFYYVNNITILSMSHHHFNERERDMHLIASTSLYSIIHILKLIWLHCFLLSFYSPRFRGTLGACFSTTLGSVLHELFHTFDLGHTENGVMGRGFDNIYKIFLDTSFDKSKSSTESSRTIQDTIQFQEVLQPESLSERLLAQNKKKGCIVVKKVDDVGDTVLEKSCVVLLCYHK